jgi:hypothetical protein
MFVRLYLILLLERELKQLRTELNRSFEFVGCSETSTVSIQEWPVS